MFQVKVDGETAGGQTDSPERQVEEGGADSIGIPAVILNRSTGTKATWSSAAQTTQR